MPNTFITPTWVSTDVAMNFENQVRLIAQFDRGYGDEWQNKPKGAQIGYTVQQRIQQRFKPTNGQALQIQPIYNQTVPISLTDQIQVGTEWSTADDTVIVEDVQERYTKPAGKALGGAADVLGGANVYKMVAMTIGTPGTAITNNQTILDGVAKLVDIAAPDKLCAVLSPKAMAAITGANFAIFNLPGGDRDFRTGQFSGENLNVDDWYTDANMPTHTTGTFTTATPIVSGAGQTGSSLLMAGMGTYSMKEGDTFTIANVNSVNPVSYVDTGDLQEFTLTADLAGTTTGTFSIYPPIITSGQLQTVVAGPAASAAVSWKGSTGTVSATMAATASKVSLIFNPAAFAFVNAPLSRNLAGAVTGQIRDADAKISIRYVEQYNIQTDQMPQRFDMLVGAAPVLPYYALRMWS